MIQQELNEWDENVKSFVKEKQMTKEVQKEFLEEYDSYLFRGGIADVEWFYNELYGGNKWHVLLNTRDYGINLVI